MLKTLKLATASLAVSTTALFAGPYDDYAGTTLIVNFPAHPHYDAVMQILPEFTKETGIEVEVDQSNWRRTRASMT